MKYCLDTNVLIEPSKGWYAFDIAPSFWEALLDWNEQNIVCSIQPVFDEIIKHKEESDLVQWVELNHKTFFLPIDESTLVQYTYIANLVSTLYESYLVEDFLKCADPFVIAYTKAHDLILVTDEKPRNEGKSPNGKIGGKKIKIPNVCDRVNVRYISTTDMLRDLKFRFK